MGEVNELKAMKTCKKQKSLPIVLVFGQQIFSSKIIAKFIENHSEFCECANKCNKFVSSLSWKTIQFFVSLL